MTTQHRDISLSPFPVSELQNFFKVPYGGTLKFNLVLNSSLVRLLYIPDADHKDRVIMEKGELMIPEELGLQDRFSVDGSICVLEGVKSSDAGVFKIVDLDGYLIANNHLQVEGAVQMERTLIGSIMSFFKIKG